MKIISAFLFLLFLPVVAAAEATTKEKTMNKRIHTDLRTWYSAPRTETHDRKDNPKLKRVSPWEHQPISIQRFNGGYLQGTLHFAEFSSSIFHEGKEHKFNHRITLISVQEGNKHKIRWLGQSWAKDVPCFFEMDGEVLRPNYFSGELFLTGSILWEREFDFSFTEREEDWETPLLELLAGEVKVSNRRFLFGGFHPTFSQRGILDSAPWGGLLVRNPIIQDDVLCIEVRNPNPNYPRTGKIWLDLRKKKALKTEDTTEQKIWDEQNRVFGVWPPPEFSKKVSDRDSYRVGDIEYKLMP